MKVFRWSPFRAFSVACALQVTILFCCVPRGFAASAARAVTAHSRAIARAKDSIDVFFMGSSLGTECSASLGQFRPRCYVGGAMTKRNQSLMIGHGAVVL